MEDITLENITDFVQTVEVLQTYIAIYVPSTIHDRKAPAGKIAAIREQVQADLSVLFGGCTETTATGTYFSNDLDKVIRERIYIEKAYHNTEIGIALNRAIDIAQRIKNELQQESVTIETHNGILFV